MAVREFDGVDDQILLGGDGTGLSAWGLVFVVRFMVEDATARGVMSVNAGANTVGAFYTSTNAPSFGSTPGDAHITFDFNTTNWYVFGFSKAAGAVPRFHRRDLTGGGGATHTAGTDDGGSTGDQAGNWDTTTVGSFRDSSGDHNIRLATAAVFDTAYADADFDGFTSTQTLVTYAAAGDRVWDFNQAAVGTDVNNLLTGLDDQSTRTGTTVIADGVNDPPGWTFGIAAAAAVGNRMRRWQY